MSTSATRIRAGAVALAAAGVLFLAYPALRPWHDEGTVAGATASMSSTAWVTAHFFAVWRSHVLPRTSAILFATGMALFLPQFFGPAPVRIGHGILLAAGSIILAAALWAAAGRPPAAVTPLADSLRGNGATHTAHYPAEQRIPS